jgi:hypothetical protein
LEKGLISKIYRELQKIDTKTASNAIDRWTNESNSSQTKYKWPINT